MNRVIVRSTSDIFSVLNSYIIPNAIAIFLTRLTGDRLQTMSIQDVMDLVPTLIPILRATDSGLSRFTKAVDHARWAVKEDSLSSNAVPGLSESGSSAVSHLELHELASIFRFRPMYLIDLEALAGGGMSAVDILSNAIGQISLVGWVSMSIAAILVPVVLLGMTPDALGAIDVGLVVGFFDALNDFRNHLWDIIDFNLDDLNFLGRQGGVWGRVPGQLDQLWRIMGYNDPVRGPMIEAQIDRVLILHR